MSLVSDGGVTCRLDYSHKDRVVVQFYTLRKLLGRGTFKRDAAQAPVCATVALTGTGAKLQVDWTGVLFPPRYRDKKVRYLVTSSSLHRYSFCVCVCVCVCVC